MPWTLVEGKPNTFIRPLGPNEVFIKLVSDPGHSLGREHWAVNYTATTNSRGAFAALSGSSEVLQKLIRYSWLHLRFQHPSLSAHPDGPNSNVVYPVPESADILREWVSETCTVVADAKSADEVIATIAPAPDARLYYVSQSSELLLHTAHWRMDGVGGLLLIGQLVDLMVSHADTFLSSLAAGAIGVPYTGDASTIPSGTRAAELTFSPATTSAARGRHYTSTIKHPLRPYLPEPYSTPAAASGLYTSGWLARVDASGAGEENARMEVMEKYLEREYGSPEGGFDITHADVGVEMLPRQGVVFVWTFGDQLTLRLVYNEAFHTPEQMTKFVNT